MGSEHQQWLASMEEKSRRRQEKFMDDIATKLKRPRQLHAPIHAFRGSPDFWNELEWDEEQRIQAFTDNFVSVGAHIARMSNMEEVAGFIGNKAHELSAKYLIRQNEQALTDLGLEKQLPDVQVSVWNSAPDVDWRARAAEADIGIVMADYATAYTGSVTVLSSPEKGRSVSLLPTVLILIIPLERLHTRLGETLKRFDEAGRVQLPAGIHFISGPSRSSDIENDLTIGVHGPGIVYGLIVG
ncbi:LUD domain-containing protein [Paenibacillus polysaccharolyticus]|uniref:LutC/YkgG family protein n=1 Tax=Paenibacillus polysaccharolyticus TaxID=582692 RepID=UPI00203A3BD4|nr:LUD domain-containing protein [Paenibacillus polysaccharolyticus]MCM3132220.1 LUD domain-containing protein [Paenibacillus polysaccharolyticus]